MRLGDQLRQKLLDRVDPTCAGLIDDACELLTGQFVLWLKAKRDALKGEFAATSRGAVERDRLATRINMLGRLMVEVAEVP